VLHHVAPQRNGLSRIPQEEIRIRPRLQPALVVQTKKLRRTPTAEGVAALARQMISLQDVLGRAA
jgi:hypothetical protein